MKAVTEDAPKEGWTPVPIALVVLFALLFYWGLVYVDDHGGGFNPKVYRPYESYVMLNDAQPVTDITNQLYKEGAIVFRTCAACHQDTGIGSPQNGCPPLVGSEWAVGGGPNRIIRLVLNGGSGQITVKGQQYPGATPMTPFRDTFSDRQIAAALTYVRNSWGNKASAVMPEQVKKIREETSSRHTAWTSAELLQIPDKD